MTRAVANGTPGCPSTALYALCGQLLATGLLNAPGAFGPLTTQILRMAQEAADDSLVKTVTAIVAKTTMLAGTCTSTTPLFSAREPRRRLADLVLLDAVQRSCQEFLDDHRHAAALRAQKLTPRNRILLDGCD